MKKSIQRGAGIALVLILSACARPPATTDTISTELKERSDMQLRDIDQATEYLQETRSVLTSGDIPKGRCDDPRWSLLQRDADGIVALAGKWKDLADEKTPLGITMRSRALGTFTTLANSGLGRRFELADLALSKGCFDLAERNYRSVVSEYVGAAYAGYRDRAMLGIQDVQRQRH